MKDKKKEANKRYREKNKDILKIKKKEHYDNNIEKIKEKKKEYRIKNKDKIKKTSAIYRENNKNKIKEIYKNNIEIGLFDNAKNRAKRNGVLFDLKLEDIKIPKDCICPLLGIKMQVNENYKKNNSFTIDRIDSNRGYDKDNIWIICDKANTSKSNLAIEEYELIVNNFEKIIIGKIKIIGCGDTKNVNINNSFNDIKRRVKKNKLPFDIDKEYLKYIYPKNGNCPILGIKMMPNKNKPSLKSPSVDKIIVNNGYTKGNIIWVSYKANCIKNNLSLNEMKLILSNWKKKKDVDKL